MTKRDKDKRKPASVAVEAAPSPPPAPPVDPTTEPEWVGEDLLVGALVTGEGMDPEAEILAVRHLLRRLVKRGELVARRHREHGWWEYRADGLSWDMFKQKFDGFMASYLVEQSNAV